MSETVTIKDIGQLGKVYLRIYIDGQWRLNEFKKLFEEIEELFYYLSVKKTIIDNTFHSELGKEHSPYIIYKDELFCHNYINKNILNRDSIYLGRSRVDHIYKLNFESTNPVRKEDIYGELLVRRISYSSPGSLDIFGLGNAIKEIKNFILDLIKAKKTIQAMELDNKEKEQEIESLKKDNTLKEIEIHSKEIDIEFKMKDLELKDIDIQRKKLELEEQKLKIDKLKTDILNKDQNDAVYIKKMRDSGYSPNELEMIHKYELLKINQINELLQSGKITNAELVMENKENS